MMGSVPMNRLQSLLGRLRRGLFSERSRTDARVAPGDPLAVAGIYVVWDLGAPSPPWSGT